mgnify:CR=1 FL=1
MFTFNQALLIVVIVLITGVLTFVGIQIILLLKELRKTVQRTNEVIDEIEVLIHKLGNPGQSLNNIITGVKQGINLVELIRTFFQKKNKDAYVAEE